MKKLVLKGLLAQAEQLSREEQKNVVGGYTTPPPPPPVMHWVHCQNSGGYIIGSFQSSSCTYSVNYSICVSSYPGTVKCYAEGC
ncbi:hypothetical protein DYU05_06315 [Mucilaginibacter terrenus]|uniref:Uncharacterized protein n=1 Tax=Mucilaginibacter terrenus TaxID=2482727 RepID=A0A3E2NW39_9SPHI|nr:hypothetical protein [Mucilaginibacter terrenus]RFZ85212.1 hypothetical protein DYU05_06315 [Mucilaginibacter terrenus]